MKVAAVLEAQAVQVTNYVYHIMMIILEICAKEMHVA